MFFLYNFFCLFVCFIYVTTGNEAAVYWTPKVFAEAGLDKNWVFLGTVFVGLAKVGFIFVSTFLLDKVGRRPLILTSAILMTFSVLLLAILFYLGRPPALTVIAQALFCGAFSIGWGPITWVLTSEVFPLNIRSRY